MATTIGGTTRWATHHLDDETVPCIRCGRARRCDGKREERRERLCMDCRSSDPACFEQDSDAYARWEKRVRRLPDE